MKDKSPFDTLIETKEDIDPAVLSLPALDLDRLLEDKLNKNSSSEGHDVPILSSRNAKKT